MARSLRELCIQAAVPLPPELEGPINSEHVLSLSEMPKISSGSGVSRLSAEVGRASGGVDSDAGPVFNPALARSLLADSNRASSTSVKKVDSSTDSSGGGGGPGPGGRGDPGGHMAQAAAAAVADADAAAAGQPAAAEAAKGSAADGPAAAGAHQTVDAPAAGQASADSSATGFFGSQEAGAIPVVVTIPPPLAEGIESGDPEAIASAATAAATAVLAQVLPCCVHQLSCGLHYCNRRARKCCCRWFLDALHSIVIVFDAADASSRGLQQRQQRRCSQW